MKKQTKSESRNNKEESNIQRIVYSESGKTKKSKKRILFI